jgi:hypothetical protein
MRRKGSMARRILSRINGAYVIATIALFAALGGGYATAFSGSGTVQKGALLDIPNGAVTVRSLTGIGAIKASCSGGMPSVAFTNTSGETLRVGYIGLGGNNSFDVNGSGDSENLDVEVDNFNTMYVHLSPRDGSKRPQADVQITALDTNDCATSSVAVLATNTEE